MISILDSSDMEQSSHISLEQVIPAHLLGHVSEVKQQLHSGNTQVNPIEILAQLGKQLREQQQNVELPNQQPQFFGTEQAVVPSEMTPMGTEGHMAHNVGMNEEVPQVPSNDFPKSDVPSVTEMHHVGMGQDVLQGTCADFRKADAPPATTPVASEGRGRNIGENIPQASSSETSGIPSLLDIVPFQQPQVYPPVQPSSVTVPPAETDGNVLQPVSTEPDYTMSGGTDKEETYVSEISLVKGCF